MDSNPVQKGVAHKLAARKDVVALLNALEAAPIKVLGHGRIRRSPYLLFFGQDFQKKTRVGILGVDESYSPMGFRPSDGGVGERKAGNEMLSWTHERSYPTIKKRIQTKTERLRLKRRQVFCGHIIEQAKDWFQPSVLLGNSLGSPAGPKRVKSQKAMFLQHPRKIVVPTAGERSDGEALRAERGGVSCAGFIGGELFGKNRIV